MENKWKLGFWWFVGKKVSENSESFWGKVLVIRTIVCGSIVRSPMQCMNYGTPYRALGVGA